MSDPTFVLLYVANPEASAAFYTWLLGRPPVESSPTFVMFALSGGWMLGLWRADGVHPAPIAGGGGAELGIPVGPGEVDARYAEWTARGLPIAAAPAELDFGRTFVGLDPDGHRVRVFAPTPG